MRVASSHTALARALPAMASWLWLAACSTAPAPAPPENRVVVVATDLLGTPYRYGGDTPAGFDCSGLVRYVFGHSGLIVPRTAQEQQLASRPVVVEQLQPGDLVFFRIGAQQVDHVGIFVGDGSFIHAPRAGRPVSRELLADPYYQRRFAGAGRIDISTSAAR